MQRLLSVKLTSNLPKNLSTSTSSSLFHIQPHKTFSHTKPPQTQSQNHFFNSLPTHPPPHQHKVHGFLSNPILRRQFSLGSANTLLRVSTKKLSDCRLAFLPSKFSKQSFHSNPDRIYHQSACTCKRSWLQRLSTNDVVLGLVVANVAVFLLWRMADPGFMLKNFTLSLDNFTSGRLHTLLTSAFSHIGVGHIIFNMIGLYYFGISIGTNFGPQFLLKFYLAGAVGGSVFYLVLQAFLAASSKGHILITFASSLLNVSTGTAMDSSKIPSLGASGAVSAIVLFHIYNPTTLIFNCVIPVPLVLLGMFLFGKHLVEKDVLRIMEVCWLVEKDVLRIMEGNSQISGAAHWGGAAVAAIACARLRKGPLGQACARLRKGLLK